MSCYNDTVITINGGCRDNISVYVDETGQGIRPILNFISLLSSDYNLYQQVMSTVTINSANWQETYDEVNLLQPLSAGWQETYDEVNTMQYTLTSNWQQTYEYIDLGVVNGGSF
jgi:hypothetical protein